MRLPALPQRLLLVVVLLAPAAAGCGDDDDDFDTGPAATRPVEDLEEALFDDVEGLADALAAGNYERVYDDFVSLACQELVDRETYLQNLREAQAQSTGAIQVDAVEVLSQEEGRVEARVDFTILVDGQPAPIDPAAPPNVETFVFEDGHWRSTECLGFTLTPTPGP